MQSDSLWIDAHPLLRDHVLAPGRRHRVAGLEVGVDGAELRPEGVHVDDEVLARPAGCPSARSPARDPASAMLAHPHLAGEHRGAVHPHPAGAADHHPAALAVGERAVVAVLDDVEDVEQRRPLRARRPRTRAAPRSPVCGLDAPDLAAPPASVAPRRRLPLRDASPGSNRCTGRPSTRRMIECGEEVLVVALREVVGAGVGAAALLARSTPATTMHSASSRQEPSSSAWVRSLLKTSPLSSTTTRS